MTIFQKAKVRRYIGQGSTVRNAMMYVQNEIERENSKFSQRVSDNHFTKFDGTQTR